jgi:hypothetical protein
MRPTNVRRPGVRGRVLWAAVAVSLVAFVPVAPIATAAAAGIPGTWSFTNPMTHARAFAPAVTLEDGSVITAGGMDGATYLSSAERWSAGTWSDAKSIHQAAAGQVAALLPDGKALFAGGADALSYYTYGDVYNPSTNAWSQTKNAMTHAHAYGVATTLSNGDVMVVGGYDGGETFTTGAVDIYSASAGTWKVGPSLPDGRYAFTAVTLKDGRVLVAGGDDGSLTPTSALSSAYIYDGSNWAQIQSMKRARVDAASVLLPDGRVLVAGGSDANGVAMKTAETYDPATDQWTDTGWMSGPRAGFTLSVVTDGRVIAAGGYASSPSDALNTTDLFDPTTGAWMWTGSMSVGRRYQSAAPLPDGEILVMGGHGTGSVYESTAELYSPPPPKLTYPATTFHPITPTRILDTRSGNGLSGYFVGRVPRRFQVTGRGGVPLDSPDVQVVAVTGVLTTTQSTAYGYFTIGPVFTSSPQYSTLNFPARDDRANNVAVALDSTGGLDLVYVGTGVTHAIFDVTGYFTADDTGATFYPLAEPKRLFDSREPGQGVFVAGDIRKFDVAGREVDGTVPVPADALAVTGNLTLVGPSSRGWAYVGPTITDPSTWTCSTVNASPGDTRADGVTVKLADDGSLSLVWYGPSGSTAHLVFDVTGYYRAGMGGARFVPIEPARLVDTRQALPFLGPIANKSPVSVQVRGRAGTSETASGMAGNVTVTMQTYPGYITAAPHLDPGLQQTSTLNFPKGDNRANGFYISLDASGTASFVYVAGLSGATTQLVVDVTGYFEAPAR